MKNTSDDQYYKQLFKKMKWHVKAFISKGDQHDLHQFRVQVKKLKSLLHLAVASSASKAILKDFKPLKKVFKHAGRIREAYLHLEMTKESGEVPTEFRISQLEILQNETALFNSKGKKYLKKIRKSKSLLKAAIPHLHKSKVYKFYNKQLNKVRRLLTQHEFNEQLHQCRMKIKDLLYNMEVSETMLHAKIPLNRKYLDELQETIGQWHDAQVAVDIFQENANLDPAGLSKFENQRKNLEKKILKQSDHFWEKVVQ